MLKSKAIPYEQPYVIDCKINGVDNAQELPPKSWKTIEIEFETNIKLTIIPQRDDRGRPIGLEEFTLTYHDEDYAHYESGASFTILKVSKLFLAELLQVALLDYLYWEYHQRNVTPEVIYKYEVAETTREIAEKLHREALDQTASA